MPKKSTPNKQERDEATRACVQMWKTLREEAEQSLAGLPPVPSQQPVTLADRQFQLRTLNNDDPFAVYGMFVEQTGYLSAHYHPIFAQAVWESIKRFEETFQPMPRSDLDCQEIKAVLLKNYINLD